MLCQSCGKKTATTHIKTIVNGKLMEYHLCTDCAKHKGYGNIFSNWGMDFSNLLGGFLGNSLDNSQVTRCPSCGKSNPQDAAYCSVCGSKLAEDDSKDDIAF